MTIYFAISALLILLTLSRPAYNFRIYFYLLLNSFPAFLPTFNEKKINKYFGDKYILHAMTKEVFAIYIQQFKAKDTKGITRNIAIFYPIGMLIRIIISLILYILIIFLLAYIYSFFFFIMYHYFISHLYGNSSYSLLEIFQARFGNSEQSELGNDFS